MEPSRVDDSFPLLRARTVGFTLGRPRNITVSPDGARVVFVRSRHGTDRVGCLWVYDVATGEERLVADPHELISPAAQAELPASERARRERARERAGGVVGYATDDAVAVAAFALAGRLFVADLVGANDRADLVGANDRADLVGANDRADLVGATDRVREVDVRGPVFDPRPDPSGRLVAYVRAGRLRVVELATGVDRELISEDDVSWGLAEFIAAEEMGRHRGYWWAPDGSAVLAARVDESPVHRWYIGDPANPDLAPTAVAYPAAGTPNARVSLALVTLDGGRIPVAWNTDSFPYLVRVAWRRGLSPLLQVCSRDQRRMHALDVDSATGATFVVREDRDPHWVEMIEGVPDRLPDGRLLHTVDIDDTRRLAVDGEPVSPVGLQVRAVLARSDGDVLFAASTEPTELHLWAYFPDGECAALTCEPGVYGGTGASDVLVVQSSSLESEGVETTIRKNGEQIGRIGSVTEHAPFAPVVSISRQGPRELRTALVLPRDHQPGSKKLPVLMSPYGGPHALRVVSSRGAFLEAQWLADQGFAVVVVDGRGTPGRGPAWERTVAGDLATPVLDDQVDALRSLAATNPDLDLSRVAIRGWSFGGFLAALAVLRRPDVFHAAVAGAPVTDQRLYDTCYTERYLGVDTAAEAYRVSSIIDDAPNLSRPLLLVHGLADDNVVAAHTLRFSAALLAAGRPHEVLPLPGITHVTSREDVVANLLSFEVDFLRRSLGVGRLGA